jgi:hypothetical protein
MSTVTHGGIEEQLRARPLGCPGNPTINKLNKEVKGHTVHAWLQGQPHAV